MPFALVPLAATVLLASPPSVKLQSVPMAIPSTATRVYEKPAVLRKDDPALEKRVTVDKPSVYLGELLESLAEQTGVIINASDADGAAGEELVAVLQDMPLADVMDSLVSLLSRRGVRWQWRREGDGSKKRPYAYRLLRPEGDIPAYADKMKKLVQSGFEEEAEVMIAGLDMSPEQLRQKAREYPALNYLINGRTTPYGIRAFRDCLTPEQRLKVLRGRDSKGIAIPISELAPAGQALEKYMHDNLNRLNPGTTFKSEFGRFWVPETDGQEMPTLVIGFGEVGGWSCIGGDTLQDKVLFDEEKDWTHNDETRSNPVHEAKKLTPPKKVDPELSQKGRVATPRRLGILGREGGFSLLARPQRDEGGSTSFEPWQVPIGEYLSKARKSKNVIRKWRKTSDNKPVLLLDFSGWYMTDTDPETPRQSWVAVKRLRAEQSRNTHESVFVFAVVASTNLSHQQQMLLEQGEFPLIQWLRMRGYWFGDFAKWVAASPRHYERLLSAEGVGMVEAGFVRTPSVKVGEPETEMGDRVRVVVSPDTEKAVACRIEFLAKDGRVIVSHTLPTWEAGYSL